MNTLQYEIQMQYEIQKLELQGKKKKNSKACDKYLVRLS